MWIGGVYMMLVKEYKGVEFWWRKEVKFLDFLNVSKCVVDLDLVMVISER
jgi:hypothetical protein